MNKPPIQINLPVDKQPDMFSFYNDFNLKLKKTKMKDLDNNISSNNKSYNFDKLNVIERVFEGMFIYNVKRY